MRSVSRLHVHLAVVIGLGAGGLWLPSPARAFTVTNAVIWLLDLDHC